MNEVEESILRGLEQAIAYAEGTADPAHYRVHVPRQLDVKIAKGQKGPHAK